MFIYEVNVGKLLFQTSELLTIIIVLLPLPNAILCCKKYSHNHCAI